MTPISGILEQLQKRAIAYSNQWKNVFHSFNTFAYVASVKRLSMIGWNQQMDDSLVNSCRITPNPPMSSTKMTQHKKLSPFVDLGQSENSF